MLQVKILKGLKAGTAAEREAYEQLRKELRDAYPDHLPVFLEGLKRAAGKVKMPYGAPATPAPAAGDAAAGDAATADAAAATDGEAAGAAAAAAAPEAAPEISQEEACQAVLAAADEVCPIAPLPTRLLLPRPSARVLSVAGLQQNSTLWRPPHPLPQLCWLAS